MTYDEIVLHADSNVIWFTVGLVESAESTGELHYLCAYALAQSLMEHVKTREQNGAYGQVIDFLALVAGASTGGTFAKLARNSQAAGFAVESDLIALYLLESLDCDISRYSLSWEQILKASSPSGELNKVEEERLLMIEKVVMRIYEKRASGESVFPKEYLAGDVSEIE